MPYLSPKRNNSWSPLMDLRREMDHFFDDLFVPIQQNWGNIEEVDNGHLMSFDLPGIPKDNIKIEVANNTITITGEGEEKDDKNFSVRKFQRSFTLPAGIDADKIEADYKDGVLHLMVPKSEAAKPKQIKVGNGSGFVGKLLGRKKGNKEDAEKKEDAA